jgi:hypothetical protein
MAGKRRIPEKIMQSVKLDENLEIDFFTGMPPC